MTDASYPLTVFYDGACPVCSAEMLQLQSEDRHQRIVLDDVSGEAGRDGRRKVPRQVDHSGLASGHRRAVRGKHVACLAASQLK